jgi:putative ABC transport system ATP-binding protein
LADEPTGALDSKTGEEVMTLMTDLNSQGITILVVTHDPDVALTAQRIVRIQDGKDIDDSPSPIPKIVV